jgi:AraC-like DNA-binding protein
MSPSPQWLPAGVNPHRRHIALFHVLTHGHCLLDRGGAEPPLLLESGDIVVLPDGQGHVMRSDRGATTPRARTLGSQPSTGTPSTVCVGDGTMSRVISGYMACDFRFAPFFDALPSALLIKCRDGYTVVRGVDRRQCRTTSVSRESSQWLAMTLRFAISEAVTDRPGKAAMLARLAEIMFLGIVREYMGQFAAPRVHGWLAAVKDPSIGPAMRRLHTNIRRNWTVAALAREVGMSRSALAQRFTLLVGHPPMRYLSLWRMQLAKHMLLDPAESLQTIADRVGYTSEPAFIRAFKKMAGTPPETWRRRHSSEVSVSADLPRRRRERANSRATGQSSLPAPFRNLGRGLF